MIKIKLNEDNRVIGWCSIGGLGGGELLVLEVPKNYKDYRYLNNLFIYDPLPIVELELLLTISILQRVSALLAQNLQLVSTNQLLVSSNQLLKLSNDSLIECILEMSLIVYS